MTFWTETPCPKSALAPSSLFSCLSLESWRVYRQMRLLSWHSWLHSAAQTLIVWPRAFPASFASISCDLETMSAADSSEVSKSTVLLMDDKACLAAPSLVCWDDRCSSFAFSSHLWIFETLPTHCFCNVSQFWQCCKGTDSVLGVLRFNLAWATGS